MSAKIVVSGNQQKIPTEVSVKTSSYTIPAGKYARVIANVEGSANFNINGVTALRGTANTVLASDNLRVFAPSYNNFGFVQPFQGALLSDGASSYPNTIQAQGTAFNESTNQTVASQDYTLPSGTVISGSGSWRAVVEEYEE